MEFFTNKSIWSKIVIVLVIVLLMEFIIAKPSLGGSDALEFGGKLLQPILSLAIALADAVQEVMESAIMGTGNSLLEINLQSEWYEKFVWIVTFGAVVGGIMLFGGLGLIASVIAAGISLFVAQPVWKMAKGIVSKSISSVKTAFFGYSKNTLEDANDFYLPVYSLSPEEIFKGNILLFNVDFFGKPKTVYQKIKDQEEGRVKVEQDDGSYAYPQLAEGEEIEYYYYEEDNEVRITSPQDIGADLQGIISKWYVSLRYIGLVIMMIVLLYVGIRMLLSTVASDKAKYKQMLQDWFMGMIILFSMHYIMVFSNVMVNSLTKVVASSADKNLYTVFVEDTGNGKLKEFFDKTYGDDNPYYIEENGVKGISWPTNLMGRLRIGSQLARWGSEYIGLGICFIVLVILTMFFIITYLKRVIYMAFLTLMAPLVAVTYPIDKLNDGQAQGFNKWFKEYIFNLLIQPLHLLLYYILVTSAFELAGTNAVYSLVAIGFMIPAEKLLRSFFGFEKSSTAASAFTSAALTTGMMQLMRPKGPKGGAAKKAIGGGSGKESGSDDSGKVNTKPLNDLDTTQQMGQMGLNATNSGNTNSTAQRTSNMPSQPKTKGIKGRLAALGSNAVQGIGGMAKRTIKGIDIPKNWNNAKRRFKRAAGARTAKEIARFKQDLKAMPGKGLRMAGRLAGAGVGATLGVASGVAQGDLGKVASSTVALGALGGKYGGSVADLGANKLDDSIEKFASKHTADETPDEAYNRVRNKKEYMDLQRADEKKLAKQELRKALKRNEITKMGENKDLYEQMMGKTDKDGNYQEGLFDQMYNYGLTDVKSMIAAQQMMNDPKENAVNTVEDAVTLAKCAKETEKDPNAFGTNREKNLETKKRKLMKKGFTEGDAEKASDRMLDMEENFSKVLRDIR